MNSTATSRPICKNVRQVHGSRLIYYREKTDIQFWDRHWQQYLSPEVYNAAGQGYLGDLQEPFFRYLPRQGRILEAGCGLGQHVLALRQLGYEIEAVEWSETTVQAVLRIQPNLPIRVGDVRQLDVPDGYYTAYISLGVVEHQAEGPESFLREAYRVLAPSGVILVSVPHFHVLRRLKARLGFYRGQMEGLEFYQYAFTPEEFTGILKDLGFEILDTFNCGVVAGIRTEVALVRLLLHCRFIRYGLTKCINSWSYARRHLGHTFLVVGRKAEYRRGSA
jgi:SAM-dependent methyltransferase